MKCLCFSDSHGESMFMRRALSMHRDCEVVFFLGDGLSDLKEIMPEFPNIMFYSVRGNCDFSSIHSDTQKTDFVMLMGKKIAITHGDLYGAKGGYGGLVALGIKNECDLVLFGHTHTPYEGYDSENELYLFNPGSISSSYSGGSFGVVTLTDKDILLSHGRIS